MNQNIYLSNKKWNNSYILKNQVRNQKHERCHKLIQNFIWVYMFQPSLLMIETNFETVHSLNDEMVANRLFILYCPNVTRECLLVLLHIWTYLYFMPQNINDSLTEFGPLVWENSVINSRAFAGFNPASLEQKETSKSHFVTWQFVRHHD